MKIKLNVKTFYGSKKTITLEVDINMTIEAVRNLLLSQHLENAKMIYNLRLVYPMVGCFQQKESWNSMIVSRERCKSSMSTALLSSNVIYQTELS